VVANQGRDNCGAVIVNALEDGRIIGANDRSSRLCGYDRDEVIRRTFLGLGLAASRKHREVLSAVGEVGVCRHEIVATIRTRVGP
jgi:PAS domain-containing protein